MNDRVRPLHRHSDPEAGRLGEHLVQMGRMSPADVDRVLAAQQKLKLPFGGVALRLGLIREADLRTALARQYSFPYAAPGTEDFAPELVTALRPEHPVAESIRRLRTQINLRMPKRQASRMVAILSADRAEGRSFIAANLAMAFAQANIRTLLIDMNLRHARQHEIFKRPNAQGLSTVLSGRLGLDQVDTETTVDTLSVLTAGPTPPNPQELLEARTVAPMIDAIGVRYEMVIVDTPSWRSCADAQLISALTGTSVLIARQDQTTQRDMGELVEAVRAGSTAIIGCVMNIV